MPETVEQEQELQTQSITVIEQSKSIVIRDQISYDQACEILLKQIKPLRSRWKAYWEPLRETAYKSYQGILGKFNEADKPLEAAERQIKAEIARWETEQQKIQQELQRKAEEEARKAEEEERLRIATLAEESGATEEQVNEIVNAPVLVVAPPVAPTYQKASGMSTRENWKARVTDLKKLCIAIGKGLVPTTYVMPNESVLNARAKADRATMNIPGVVPFNDPVVSGRSR